jgi:hypothetical protein
MRYREDDRCRHDNHRDPESDTNSTAMSGAMIVHASYQGSTLSTVLSPHPLVYM